MPGFLQHSLKYSYAKLITLFQNLETIMWVRIKPQPVKSGVPDFVIIGLSPICQHKFGAD